MTNFKQVLTLKKSSSLLQQRSFVYGDATKSSSLTVKYYSAILKSSSITQDIVYLL